MYKLPCGCVHIELAINSPPRALMFAYSEGKKSAAAGSWLVQHWRTVWVLCKEGFVPWSLTTLLFSPSAGVWIPCVGYDPDNSGLCSDHGPHCLVYRLSQIEKKNWTWVSLPPFGLHLCCPIVVGKGNGGGFIKLLLDLGAVSLNLYINVRDTIWCRNQAFVGEKINK